MAKLAGGVAVIKVGAATEVEMKEKKARVEDALHATRAAVEEGIVPGGGVALIRAKAAIAGLKGANEDQNHGIAIALRAMEAPLREIVTNAGDEPSVILNRVVEGKGAFGYNAANGEFGDMIEFGILDPTKVTRTALQNAASVAGLMLTTDCMVGELKGANEDQDHGIQIALRAMEAPLREIVANAGEEPSVILNKVKEGSGNFGYNAATGEFVDMVEAGILDPTKVTRSALQNAASIAGLMITTEAMVAEAPKKDEPAMPAGGGMGGMGGMDF